MTDQSKLIYVDANGDYVESSATDSLKYASFKTANYELTDALLGDVSTKMIKSDGTRAFAADQSMGGNKLTNVANGTADSDAVNYGQLSAAVSGFDWKPSIRAATTAALPACTYANGTGGVGATLTADANGAFPSQDGVSLSLNEDLLVKDQVAGLQNGLYVLTQVGDGSNPWILTRRTDSDSNAEVTANLTVAVEEGTTLADHIFQLQTNDPITVGTTALVFGKIVVNSLVGGAGITFSGETISADLYSGGGLKIVGAGDAGQIAVEPNDFAGEGLIDDGSDNLAIDWSTAYNDSKAVKASDLSSTSSGKGASIIGINDVGGYTSQTTVEGALQELYQLSGAAEQYTVGTGGVTKGDLVYISANNTVRKFATITANQRAIGIALATVSAGGTVEVQRADYVCTGCLSSATAGTEYWWDGSAPTTTVPTGSGAYVWKLGVAVNATDLLADVEFVKKNS